MEPSKFPKATRPKNILNVSLVYISGDAFKYGSSYESTFTLKANDGMIEENQGRKISFYILEKYIITHFKENMIIKPDYIIEVIIFWFQTTK